MQLQRLTRFDDLARGDFDRAVITWSSHANYAVASWKDFLARREHLVCSDDRDYFRLLWIFQLYRPGDDHNFVTRSDCSSGESLPHPAAGSISQVANWIQVLAGRSGGDEDFRHSG